MFGQYNSQSNIEAKSAKVVFGGLVLERGKLLLDGELEMD